MNMPEIKLCLALIASQLAPADLNDAGLQALGFKPGAHESYQAVMDAAMNKLAEAICVPAVLLMPQEEIANASTHQTDPAQEAVVRSE